MSIVNIWKDIMAYFNYRNLDSSDFEALAKDVMKRLLGCNVYRYGQGKDGGIDLCDNTREKHIVVQCKNYQQGSFNNLFSVLKNEEKPKLERISPRPERYYVFTSMDLTVKQKERIIDLFGDYMGDESFIVDGVAINEFFRDTKNHDLIDRNRKLFENFPENYKNSSLQINYTNILLAFLLILIILGLCMSFTRGRPSQVENSDFSGIDYYEYSKIEINPVNNVSEQALTEYNIALDLYNKNNYEGAEKTIQSALDKQISVTGVNNEVVANMYGILGLAQIYKGNYANKNNTDAETSLTTAKSIYEVIGDDWNVAWCDFYLGTYYFEVQNYNLALNECGKVLDNINDILEGKNVTELFDNPDFESAYKVQRASELRAQTLNLFGKVYTDVGNYSYAYMCFCHAIRACSELFLAERILLITPVPKKIDGFDEDDYQNIEKIIEKCEVPGIEIQYLDFDTEEGVITNRTALVVNRTTLEATLLTNRAQCGLVFGLIDEAESDCNRALEIWDGFDFYGRQNISYTYNTLIKAKLFKSSMDNTYKSEDLLHELIEYADLAVTYDRELYGEHHWRTALSYEQRGNVLFLSDKKELAIKDYQNAHDIYVEAGDEEGIRLTEDKINTLQNE